jgi:hypothetical protein
VEELRSRVILLIKKMDGLIRKVEVSIHILRRKTNNLTFK